jgi:hypothetical protein
MEKRSVDIASTCYSENLKNVRMTRYLSLVVQRNFCGRPTEKTCISQCPVATPAKTLERALEDMRA